MIEKNLNEYEGVLKKNTIICIGLFILSPAIYIILDKGSIGNELPVYLFLILVAIGAAIMGHTGIKYSSYSDILKYRDPLLQKKERKLSKASGVLWMTTIAIYLLYSFMTGNWHNSWVIFVVASVIQIVIAIVFD